MIKYSNILFSLILLSASMLASAQDAVAEAILEDYAEKINKHETLEVSYEYTMSDQQTGDEVQQKGKILIKGKKYRLEADDVIVMYDGNNLWQYLPGASEVTVASYDESDGDFFLTNPRKIFMVFNDDYKYRKTGEVTVDGKLLHEIELYPKEKEQPYSRLILFITDNSHELDRFQAFEKSGIIHNIKLTDFQTGRSYHEDKFTFKTERHPGVEVVDMRF